MLSVSDFLIGKTVYQSSTYGEWDDGPEKAIDGILNGNLILHETCSHTTVMLLYC